MRAQGANPRGEDAPRAHSANATIRIVRPLIASPRQGHDPQKGVFAGHVPGGVVSKGESSEDALCPTAETREHGFAACWPSKRLPFLSKTRPYSVGRARPVSRAGSLWHIAGRVSYWKPVGAANNCYAMHVAPHGKRQTASEFAHEAGAKASETGRSGQGRS